MTSTLCDVGSWLNMKRSHDNGIATNWKFLSQVMLAGACGFLFDNTTVKKPTRNDILLLILN